MNPPRGEVIIAGSKSSRRAHHESLVSFPCFDREIGVTESGLLQTQSFWVEALHSEQFLVVSSGV